MATDPYLYRITYANGTVKHGNRRVLGCVAGYAKVNGGGYRKGAVLSIERASEPVEWEDVTAEFIRAE